ncbi:MAG: asparagine synthase (glutamine-hydrolyzing), partial [Pseudomonadota bacterium]
MCGITGFFNIADHDRETARSTIKQMTDTLIYRGPDEEGYYVDDNVALGHRRLSIIDLSSGQQPMSTQSGRYQIVFNGEIYNYQEINAELSNLGHTFQTRSDTETILLAYVQWGGECVSRLNGMFAFAIWDKSENNLFLARDRVGKKPVYYHWNGQIFSFASELKALRSVQLCPGEIDYKALDCYYTFGYIPSPRTIYQDTCKLEPAHTLLVTRHGLEKRRYWQLTFSPRQDLTLDEATEEFEALLDEATKCRLMSEVPLGAFLSGGLDSTLVVSSMAKNMRAPVLTNSIGFGEKEFNELPLAKLVADHLRTNHKEFTLEPKAAEILADIAWHFDEPFADSSAVPTWYVCKMAKQNVTVVLSGDGGDESFGGYTFRYLPHMYES